MKSTGIVRKVDELGRIVLPVELRRIMENQRFPGNYDRGRQNCSEKIRTALRILRLEGKYLRI